MTEDSSLLLRRAGGQWMTPETRSYTNEAHLQEILVADPARIPGVSGGAMAVAELSTSAGPIDVCVVSEQGDLTVVECKLASNSERRRMVIGQVIDYASAIWQDGEAAFHSAWASRGGPELTDTLSADALARLKSNIAEARINLCLAVDQIDADLRRLVQYLNRVTSDHIAATALELTYVRDGDLEILIPSTYGGELAATKRRTSGGPRTPWTRESFLQALEADVHRPLAHALLSRTEQLERRGTTDPIWYGSQPGGSVYLHPFGLQRGPIYLWPNSAGELLVYGTWNTWNDTAGHDGYASLARLLGQDHTSGSARGVRVVGLDFEELWSVATECALAINGEPGGPS